MRPSSGHRQMLSTAPAALNAHGWKRMHNGPLRPCEPHSTVLTDLQNGHE
jgi:hypothetical protein